MADFGGNVGLWIGASIFTILEFVELFTKICVSKLCRTEKCQKPGKSLFKDNSQRKRRNGNQQVPLKDIEQEEAIA